MPKDEIISAFAFQTGKEIEKLINERTNNLQDENEILIARILRWYEITKDPEFAKHFGIGEDRKGIIPKK
jgi:hypothetical protein